MTWRSLWFAPLVALAALLAASPDASAARGWGGRGGWGGGYRGGWGGYRGGWGGGYGRGWGWGGYGNRYDGRSYYGGFYPGYGYGLGYGRAYYPGRSYGYGGYGYGLGYWNYPYVGSTSAYYGPSVGDTTAVPSTVTVDVGTPAAYEAPAQDNVAHLRVAVPADAELWFDGVRTQQTGTEREFVSPPLAPGRSYHYEVRARWTENGRAIDQMRRIEVRANEWKDVDFSQPAAALDTATPPPLPRPADSSRNP